MKKNNIHIWIITFIILIAIACISIFNINYKTDEEKWDIYISNLKVEEKKYDDDAFLMSLIYKNDVTDEGITLEGKVLRGTLNVNDTICLVGEFGEKKVAVKKILNENNEESEVANENERVNVIISGVSKNIIKPGQVLAKENTIKAHKEFIAEIYVLSEAEGGIDKTIKKNDFIEFYIRTASFVGKVEKIKKANKIEPGSAATIKVKLNTAVAMEEGTTFVIRSDSQTLGAGEITKVIQ